MSRTTYKMLACVLPVLFGALIPPVGLVNIPWGSLFGIGGAIFESLAPYGHHRFFDLIGVLLWPTLMFALVGRMAGYVYEISGRPRKIITSLFVVSLFWLGSAEHIVTAQYGEDFDYKAFPLYIKLLMY